jgi:hypothetical protein
MAKRTLYQIRIYKTPTSYSAPMGFKLRDRWRSIRLIARLTRHTDDLIVMVPFVVHQ